MSFLYPFNCLLYKKFYYITNKISQARIFCDIQNSMIRSAKQTSFSFNNESNVSKYQIKNNSNVRSDSLINGRKIYATVNTTTLEHSQTNRLSANCLLNYSVFASALNEFFSTPLLTSTAERLKRKTLPLNWPPNRVCSL